MKKWANIVAVVIVVALLVWAGSQFFTAMAKLTGFLNIAVLEDSSRFIDEEMDVSPTLPPESLELTDQDYDAVQAEAEAQEDVAPRSTDYLTDGDEMLPVDETIEELAE